MKAELKSANALVRLLYAHGEKIGMLGIVVCTGMLLWSALGRDRLGEDSEPEDLQQIASRASSRIDDFKWESLGPEDKKIVGPVSSGAMKPIDRSHFPPPRHGINRPVLDPVQYRLDPGLLPAEELEVYGDSGLWASADPETIKKRTLAAIAQAQKNQQALEKQRERDLNRDGRGRDVLGQGREGLGMQGEGALGRRGGQPVVKGGAIVQISRNGAQLQGYEDIRARSWVTVLAKIPVELQYQNYENALQEARGYVANRDIPQYLGYRIERALVTDQGQQEWESLDTVTEDSIVEKISTYPIDVPDVIDPSVNHPILTYPLPPLILRSWDRRASHSSMPLASELEGLATEELEQDEELEPTEEDDDPFAVARRGNDGGRRGEIGRSSRRGEVSRGGYPAGRRPGGRGMEGMGMGMEGMGMGMEMEGMGMGMGGMGMEGRGGFAGGGGRSRLGRGTDTVLAEFVWDHETSHVLLRFFDTNVTPGLRYRYRVRLALQDVNHSVSEKYLDKTVTERRSQLKKKALRYRFTDWSKPSPIASVPLPGRIFLVGAKAARQARFNDEPKAKVLIKALNSEYAAEVGRVESFARGSVINLHDKAEVIWASNYQEEQEPEFDFHTGVTILDFVGGEQLSGRKNKDLTAPTRAILMDPAGRLTLQSELDDYEPVAEFKQILEQGTGDRRGRQRGREGMEGLGEFEGGLGER